MAVGLKREDYYGERGGEGERAGKNMINLLNRTGIYTGKDITQ